MSKIAQILKEQDLDRFELEALSVEVGKLLQEFRPYRIKETLKTCGKPGCPCGRGKKHGPYLFVSYRDGKKTVQKSLGPKMEEADFSDLEAMKKPDWFDEKYHMPFSAAENLAPRKRDELGLKNVVLTHEQFEELYDISPELDRFRRPLRLWVNYAEYEADMTTYRDGRRVLWSPWSDFGVGTSRGVDILNSLEDRGYYLAG